MMRIGVIDGQGGGIGSAVIKRLKARYGETVEIVALGTNAIATANMLKARANRGASGDNAIVHSVQRVDILIGPLGIIMADAMLGEISARVARAVAGCRAHKYLLPLTQEKVSIVGADGIALPRLIDALLSEHLPERLGDGCPEGA